MAEPIQTPRDDDITPIDSETLWDEFHHVVTMPSRELQQWLAVEAAGETAEQVPDQAGPELGRRVLAILGKRRTDLTDDDLAAMREVVECVADLDEQGDPHTDHALRRRMMDLGHDPLRPRPDSDV